MSMISSKDSFDTNSYIIQYLPLFIAIIAGLFAIIQVRLNHNANYRLKWIEGFRNAVSLLLSEVNDYSATLTKIISDERHGLVDKDFNKEDMIRFQNAIKNSTRYFNEVILFLDPKNERHQEIKQSILDIEKACMNSSPNIEDFVESVGQHFDRLINLAQIEISDQWKKSQKWTLI